MKYQCELCGTPHDTMREAERCENDCQLAKVSDCDHLWVYLFGYSGIKRVCGRCHTKMEKYTSDQPREILERTWEEWL